MAVPTHTFKVVFALRGGGACYYPAIVPNREATAEPLEHVSASVAEVERKTGLHFLSAAAVSRRCSEN